MTFIDPFLLKDPYEVSDTVRRAMEPRCVQFMGMKLIMVSNPSVLPPGVIAHLSSGPKPEQNVWVLG